MNRYLMAFLHPLSLLSLSLDSSLIGISLYFLYQVSIDAGTFINVKLSLVFVMLFYIRNTGPSTVHRVRSRSLSHPMKGTKNSTEQEAVDGMKVVPIMGSGLSDFDVTGPVHLDADHEFLQVKFSHEKEIGCDVLRATARKEFVMDDKTVAGVLDDVGQVLEKTHRAHTHFASIYDIRDYQLPGVSKSFARAKQLVAWCDSYEHLIDKHIHSVAVVVPSGFGAKLLKNCVSFVIYVTQPPMEPRVFEDDIGAAEDFLRERLQKYHNEELMCKPSDQDRTLLSNPPTPEAIEKNGSTCRDTWKKEAKKTI